MANLLICPSSEPNIFIEEADNIKTDVEGDSMMLGVPVIEDYFNAEMVDAPSRPSSKLNLPDIIHRQ